MFGSSLFMPLFWVLASCIGFAIILAFLLIGGFVVYAIVKRSTAGQVLSQVDFTDGIDAKEEALLRSLFAKQKAEADEIALKEKLAKVSGYELSD